MAPASNKRKRPERQASEDDGSNRPSPYRPDKSRMTRRASKDTEKHEVALSGHPEEPASISTPGNGGQNGDIEEAITAAPSATLVSPQTDLADVRADSNIQDKLTLRLLQVELAGWYRNTSDDGQPLGGH